MSKIIDIIGNKYGELEVIGYSHTNDNYRSYWICRCSCGNIKTISKHNLTTGRSRSCGHNIKYNSVKHNMSYDRFYNTYRNIKSRCFNLNNEHYMSYGGRGITVCDRWVESFDNFMEDMYDSYLKHLEIYGVKDTTIDRIDNNGNYEPSNCRWATRKQQANNTRVNSGWFKKKELR